MAEYMMELRKLVGHRPLLQCAASVIIENSNGEILLGKRTDNHKWGYAGGSIELGETIEDCACRELFEETGLIADELRFFMINSGEETHYIYPNGDEVYNVEVVYLCSKYHGTLAPQPDEIEELRFFPVSALPEALSDPIIPVFSAYRRHREQSES
ncbi:MAG: NUDIX hydrolase [Solobacterium sp.]|nr:NUDIX hydrolase [Solobacterium sp.]MBR2770349.1 NUDIX hydrolase [Solobacterium sp.]MBR2794184.1 NUDIX hydrolase [Solobacterium sp.]